MAEQRVKPAAVKPAAAKPTADQTTEGQDDAEIDEADVEEDAEEETPPPPPPPAPKKKKTIASPPEGKPTATPVGAVYEAKSDDLELSDCILDSPQPFGIHIGGELHSFRKGKTRLNKKQLRACKAHRYVRDNGAAIYVLPTPDKK